MKKIITVLLSALILCACGNKGLNIDVESKTKELLGLEAFSGVSMMDVSKAELKYTVDLSNAESISICLPTDSERANMFIIAKAKDDAETLFDEIDMIVDKYDHSWNDVVYNAEESKKVKNKTIVKEGNYYICVISDDNDSVINTIKK